MTKMKISDLLRIFIHSSHFYVILASEFSLPPLENLAKISSKRSIPVCQACQNLVQSFMQAVKETTRLSFAGGDADWEKEKLGNYENSELRFIEIQEKLCFDLKSGSDQCHNLAELHEAELESWFFSKRDKKSDDLFTYLCVNNLKTCCPNNTYGPNCIPCPGGIDEPCSGHGKCKNGGTREEPGECICDSGYAGHLCNECKVGYYKDSTTTKLTCRVCDKACKDHCRGPGPNSCEVCSDGYNFIPNKGCFEIEEEDEDVNQSSSETDTTNLGFKPEAIDINSQESNHQEL